MILFAPTMVNQPPQSSTEIFINGRARLTRIRDAKICNCWVRDLSLTTIRLGLKDQVSLEFDDVYMVEVFGIGVRARFEAKVTRRRTVEQEAAAQEEADAPTDEWIEFEFELISPFEAAPSSEPARFQVANLVAVLNGDSQNFAAPVVDIAPKGIAVICPKEIQKGTELKVMINTRLGPVEVHGEVRYSRSTPKSGNQFRVGIQFTSLGRVDQGRWDDLLTKSRALTEENDKPAPIGNLRIAEAAFIGAGARITRHGDGGLLAGWVLQMEESDIVIQSDAISDLSPDDTVSIEVFGFEHHLLYEARMKERYDTHFSFEILNEQPIKAAREDHRIVVQGMEITIPVDGEDTIVGFVVDVSANGLMFSSPEFFPQGSRVELTVRTEFGPVKTDAEIRYCKPMEDGNYRVGVLIYEMGRIERGRWKRIVDEAA